MAKQRRKSKRPELMAYRQGDYFTEFSLINVPAVELSAIIGA
jgi:hypothetical protein